MIKNDEIDNYQDYYKQILFYLSKNENQDILNQLDLDLIIDNYIKFYDELDISIWEFILENIFNIEDKDKFNDYISILMKFFEEKPKRIQAKHLVILIENIKNHSKPIISKILFNTLITLYSSGINLDIYLIVSSLEKTISFYEEENIRKILGFYQHYLREKGNKYKDFVYSRFVKLKYELDKYGKEKFISEFNIDKSKADEKWLDYVKRRFKFLTMNSGLDIINNIPIRLDFELSKKVYKIKSADKIYKKIIESYKDDKLDNKKNEINEKLEIKEDKEIKVPINNEKISSITKDNIVLILEDIQEFIENNKDKFNQREIKRIYNTMSGLFEDIKDIKKIIKN